MAFTPADLPALNALLTSISTVFIVAGWIAISRDQKRVHAACMITALVTSSVFLVGYLVHKYFNGTTRFVEPASVKPYYLVLLFTHLILAMAIVPLVIKTVYHAARRQWDRHRRIARWTMPIWLYVSVTGVLVYFVLYQWYPQAPTGL